jgi:hypothetical protein
VPHEDRETRGFRQAFHCVPRGWPSGYDAAVVSTFTPAGETAMLRIINSALLLAAVCGALFALRAERTRRELAREHRRLAGKVGFLSIDDEHKLHVRALPTGDPLHFAWQIYFPAGCQGKWRSRMSPGYIYFGNHSSGQESGREIVRIRFQKIDGRWQGWMKRGGSSLLLQVTEPIDELLEHPERLHVEQLGVAGPIDLNDDELIDLLRITSDEPIEGDRDLLLVQFGTPEAWAKAEADAGR